MAQGFSPSASRVTLNPAFQENNKAGSGLLQLADSLKSFAPQLGQMAQTIIAKQQATATAKYQAELASTSDEDLEGYHKDATAAASSIESKALEAQFGIRLAAARRRKLDADIQSGAMNLADDDPEPAIRQLMKQDLDTFQTPEFAATYAQSMEQTVETVRGMSSKAVAIKKRGEILDNYSSILSDSVETAIAHGASADELAGIISKVKEVHGPGTAFNLDRKTLNDGILQTAANLMRDGHYDQGVALLDKSIGGAPALSKIRDYAEMADKLRDQGLLIKRKNDREAAFNEVLGIIQGAYSGASDPMAVKGRLEALGYDPGFVAGLSASFRGKREAMAKEAQTRAANGQLYDLYLKVGKGEVSPDSIEPQVKKLVQQGSVSGPAGAQIMLQATNAEEKRKVDNNFQSIMEEITAVYKGERTSEDVQSLSGFWKEMGRSPDFVASLAQQADNAQAQLAKNGGVALRVEAADQLLKTARTQDVAALLSGSFESQVSEFRVPTPEGGSRAVTVDERREAALNDAVTIAVKEALPPDLLAAAQKGDQQALSTIQTLQRDARINIIQANGIQKDDVTTRTLMAGFNAASAGGQVGPAAKIGLDTYAKLSSIDPASARRLAGNEAADYYESVTSAAKYLYDGNLDEAMSSVKRTQPDDPRVKAVEANDTGLKTAVSGALDMLQQNTRGWIPGYNWTGEQVTSPGDQLFASQTIGKLSRNVAANLDVTPEQAVNIAKQQFVETHRVVGGRILPVAKTGAGIPENIDEISKAGALLLVKQQPDMTFSNTWGRKQYFADGSAKPPRYGDEHNNEQQADRYALWPQDPNNPALGYYFFDTITRTKMVEEGKFIELPNGMKIDLGRPISQDTVKEIGRAGTVDAVEQTRSSNAAQAKEYFKEMQEGNNRQRERNAADPNYQLNPSSGPAETLLRGLPGAF